MTILIMFYRILKFSRERKLEELKDKWWNNNPEKKICEKEKNHTDGISFENIGNV